MFNLSYTQPARLRGQIHMEKPITSLGTHTDIHGNRWDVKMARFVDGKNFVAAVPTDELHPYYSDTSMTQYDFVEQVWEPYEVIVHENHKQVSKRL